MMHALHAPGRAFSRAAAAAAVGAGPARSLTAAADVTARTRGGLRSRRTSTAGPDAVPAELATPPVHRGWVPEAYRGARRDPAHRASTRHPTATGLARLHPKARVRTAVRGRGPAPLLSREERRLEKERLEREAVLTELVDHWRNNLLRLAYKYQARFGIEAPLGKNDGAGGRKNKSKPLSKEAAMLAHLSREMNQVFSAVHPPTEAVELDNSVDMKTLLDTEDQYRGLCRALQKAIELSMNLARSNLRSPQDSRAVSGKKEGAHRLIPATTLADNAADYIEMAEQATLALATFAAERTALVDALVKKEMTVKSQQQKERGAGPLQRSRTSGLFRRVANMIFGLNKSSMEAETPENEDVQRIAAHPAAHTDVNFGVTRELLASVLRSLHALVVTQPGDGPAYCGMLLKQQSQEQRELSGSVAKRMIKLLSVMPSTEGSSDGKILRMTEEMLELVLDIMCREGTLKSADACYATYQQHVETGHAPGGSAAQLQFALILQSYLGAVQHERDDKSRAQAAEKAMTILFLHWDKNFPRINVHRVLHASIVLHCFSAAGRLSCTKENEDIQSQVERLVVRAFGRQVHRNIMNELESSSTPSLDYFSLPVINYLSHFYAESSSVEKLALAKKMLLAIMSHERVGVGGMIVVPIVETANIILQAIAGQYENKPKQEWQGLDPESDLRFALKLVDDMLQRRESRSWPDSRTFKFVFRLLLASRPADIGQQAEQLLSKMEMRNILSPSEPISISLSTYHRALRCWLEAAKLGVGPEPCEQALRMLNRLDLQSRPLLLSDAEVRMPVATKLYNVLLRPTRPTYNLVIQICLDTRDEDAWERAFEVASEAYARMEAKGIAPDKQGAKKLAVCRNRLLRKEPTPSSPISDETLELLTNPKELSS